MNTAVESLIINFRVGARLAFLRPVQYNEFSVDIVQVFVWLGVMALMTILLDSIELAMESGAEATDWGYIFWSVLMTVAAAFAVATIQRNPSLGSGVIVVGASAVLIPLIIIAIILLLQLVVIGKIDENSEAASASDAAIAIVLAVLAVLSLIVGGLLAGWSLLIGYRGLRCIFDASSGRTLLLLIIYILIALAPDLYNAVIA